MDHLEIILEKLEDKKNVFLTGGAGVGKTTMTKKVIEHFEQEVKKVAKLASTGMAATLIGGQTLHSFFELGICKEIAELEREGKKEIKRKLKKLISSIDLLVIDEISMVSDTLMEMIRFRLIQGEFRGSVLVVGDFLQLPPVVRGSNGVRFAFESKAWSEFSFFTMELTHIYRTSDEEFIELLNEVRFGRIDEERHNQLNEFIKPLPQDLSGFTFLFGKNSTASMHNKHQLSFIEGEPYLKELEIVKHVKNVKESEIDRFINDAKIEKSLEFKIGAPVLFTRNSCNYLNVKKGNILNLDANYIFVQKSDSKLVKLERIAQTKKRWVEKEVNGVKEMLEEDLFSIHQYPIRLAFAITIHKSQGMSIEDLIIETNEIFAPSQFYVALSRSSNPKRLTLIAPRAQWHQLAFVDNKAKEFTVTAL